jgi:hypothetical protein
MFCPYCGTEDSNKNQFCRNCGTSLHAVRLAVEHPDAITASAVTAREEIGRAIAGKISEFKEAHEMRIAAYEILPAIERFLESPEERRLHQQETRLNKIREGVLTSVVGIGVALSFLFISWITREEKILIVSALGLFVLLIGLAITATASWCTVPGRIHNASRTRPPHGPGEKPNGLKGKGAPAGHSAFNSVTEGTTREL